MTFVKLTPQYHAKIAKRAGKHYSHIIQWGTTAAIVILGNGELLKATTKFDMEIEIEM